MTHDKRTVTRATVARPASALEIQVSRNSKPGNLESILAFVLVIAESHLQARPVVLDLIHDNRASSYLLNNCLPSLFAFQAVRWITSLPTTATTTKIKTSSVVHKKSGLVPKLESAAL